MTAAIEAAGVSRWFGEQVAVRDVSFVLHQGVTVVEGANGAGKSTLLALLAGALRPSAGVVRVLGEVPWRSARSFSSVGYVPQRSALPGDLTPRQLVTFAARTSLGWRRARPATARLLDAFDLGPVADRPAATCSNGNRQRVRLAMAFAGNPLVAILDEPFVGLDTDHRTHLAGRLRELASDGRTIVVSSHVDTVLAADADHVLTLVRGRLAAGDSAALVRVEAVGAPELAARLLRTGLATRIDTIDAGAITFETGDLDELAGRLVRIAALSGTRIDRLVTGAAAAGERP